MTARGRAVDEASRDVLAAAIAAVEDGDGPGALDAWMAEHEAPAEVVVGGAVLDNLGSPLYLAVVYDAPAAVQRLVACHGADVNYAHGVHGDTPLLHACQQGYTRCLQALLSAASLDIAAHLTRDRKLFLGQGVPQWEEGGCSALHVAITARRVDAVRALVSGEHLARGGVAWLLAHEDTFGRRAIRVALDALAVANGVEQLGSLRSIALEVVRSMAVHGEAGMGLPAALAVDAPTFPVDATAYIAAHTPPREAAEVAARNRVLAVRARVLTRQAEVQEAERVRGLRAIAEHYTPLHRELYTPRDVNTALSTVFNPAAAAEPFPGLFTFPLLSDAWCTRIWDELRHYERAAVAHPAWALPLPVRHDGNVGNLQNCGLQVLLDAVMRTVAPLLEAHLPDALGAHGVEAYHAFFTRNHPDLEKNATFKMHCDKSELTLNLCVHRSPDVEGSTVGFYTPKAHGATPEDDDRGYTHVHRVGLAVVHTGATWHRTDAITRGARGSLIIWARRRRGPARAER